MTRHETVLGFASLFHGRPDAYFLSKDKGGICIRTHVTLEHYRRHLAGQMMIGTYPVTDDARCRWSCIDIDEDDWTKATDTWSAWRHYGITAWIERSRSKGFHVWVFTGRWVPASTMRDAGLWIARMADLGKIEVNPKNDAPWKTKTGIVNTVRIPYSPLADPGRMVMVDAVTKTEIALEMFVDQATKQLCTMALLAALQNRERLARETEMVNENARRIRERISTGTNGHSYKGAKKDWHQNGPAILNGETIRAGNRDNELFTFAKFLKSVGYDKNLALATMERIHRSQVDQSGDYYPLSNALEKVERAYG